MLRRRKQAVEKRINKHGRGLGRGILATSMIVFAHFLNLAPASNCE
jgi:hypothetical protein